MQEIAAASQEQTTGVGQINAAMTQLNQTTQMNASASEELAATAEEMTGQAEQLQQLMAFFRLQETAAAQTAPKRQATRRSGSAPGPGVRLPTGLTPALAMGAAAGSERDFVAF